MYKKKHLQGSNLVLSCFFSFSSIERKFAANDRLHDSQITFPSSDLPFDHRVYPRVHGAPVFTVLPCHRCIRSSCPVSPPGAPGHAFPFSLGRFRPAWPPSLFLSCCRLPLPPLRLCLSLFSTPPLLDPLASSLSGSHSRSFVLPPRGAPGDSSKVAAHRTATGAASATTTPRALAVPAPRHGGALARRSARLLQRTRPTLGLAFLPLCTLASAGAARDQRP